jgi:hypothetical protein
MTRRCIPRPIATLFVVLKDGKVELIRMRSLRFARSAAHQMNADGNYRAVFAMWR